MYLGSACVEINVLITVMLHCASILRLREGGLGLNDNYPRHSLEGSTCPPRLRAGM